MGLAMLVLERCLAADREIETMQIRYAQDLDVATSVGQPLTDTGDRHADGTHSEKVANGACELAEQQEKIDARKHRRSAEAVAVSRMTKRLPVTQAQVIHLCYIKRLPLGAVAKKLNFSYGYVRNVKSDALKLLAKITDDEVADLLPPDYPQTITPEELETLLR